MDTLVKVALIYPYFQPDRDDSIFRFPPLGLGYVASSLQQQGADVEIVDCTFLTKEQAIEQILRFNPDVLGFYSMFSMKKKTFELAGALRSKFPFLVVGGPLPTLNPEEFLEVFDTVVIGEGEQTMAELVGCFERGLPFSSVRGIAFKDGSDVKFTKPREFIRDLDQVPFPSRALFDNAAYKRYFKKQFGYTSTPLISSRGCPFSCDFCSRPVFGTSFRARSASNIADEVEQIADLGYDRVWFADDCFTLNREHLINVCDELVKRRVDIGWECLSRVDTLDSEVASSMKSAGCIRVFFGIESGNDAVLGMMNKRITVEQARKAVFAAKAAGLQAGAFFIVGYPGETDRTVLDTIRFASRLPLDYLSFTLPYPIPGTGLFERVKDNGGVLVEDWEEPKNWSLIRHKLLYGSSFSETKLKLAIAKAQVQFHSRRLLGNEVYSVFGEPLERLTDWTFEKLR